jgi:hypothetical protein
MERVKVVLMVQKASDAICDVIHNMTPKSFKACKQYVKAVSKAVTKLQKAGVIEELTDLVGKAWNK